MARVCLGYRVVGAQVHFFIFDGAPEPLHKHIVAPCAPAVHADDDGVVSQQAGERRAGELATLIRVEDLRFTMAGQIPGFILLTLCLGATLVCQHHLDY